MSNATRPTNAITHAGVFHADDVFACAFLFLINSDLVVERLFKVPENISENTVVFDIGGGRYDHHTKESAEFPHLYSPVWWTVEWNEPCLDPRKIVPALTGEA